MVSIIDLYSGDSICLFSFNDQEAPLLWQVMVCEKTTSKTIKLLQIYFLQVFQVINIFKLSSPRAFQCMFSDVWWPCSWHSLPLNQRYMIQCLLSVVAYCRMRLMRYCNVFSCFRNVVIISIFYGLPVIQLVFTYQRVSLHCIRDIYLRPNYRPFRYVCKQIARFNVILVRNLNSISATTDSLILFGRFLFYVVWELSAH